MNLNISEILFRQKWNFWKN